MYLIKPLKLQTVIENSKDKLLLESYSQIIAQQNYSEIKQQLKTQLKKIKQLKSQQQYIQPKGDQSDISLQSLVLFLLGQVSYLTNDFIISQIIARYGIEYEKNTWLQIEFTYMMIISLQKLNKLEECLNYIESLRRQLNEKDNYKSVIKMMLKKKEYLEQFQNRKPINFQELGQNILKLIDQAEKEQYFQQIGYPTYIVESSWMLRFEMLCDICPKNLTILKQNELEDESFIEILKDSCSFQLYEELERISSAEVGDLLFTPIYNDNLIEFDLIQEDPFKPKLHTNIALKGFVKEGVHFHYVSSPVWKLLKQYFGGYEIRRTVIPRGNTYKVETHLMRIQYQLGENKYVLQMNSNERIFDLIEKVQRIHGDLILQVLKGGDIISKDSILQNSQIGFEDILIMSKERISNKQICQYCKREDNDLYFCECMSVKYCNQSCLMNDRKNHKDDCQKKLNKEQFINQLARKFKVKPPSKITRNSIRGLCGLQNLGNTCFMNSSLQCLSHVLELTEFMISNEFLQDLNEKNPLGTGGKLACAYADLLKELWEGSSQSTAPWNVKNIIGRYAPQFGGYSQQDSAELLSYLLDGLHEDLNKVKKKPYIVEVEYQNQSDEELSNIYLENHLLRNNSIIIDLFSGQFKSRVECPDCKNISITFDPFVSVSLPIPTKEYQQFNFYLIFRNSSTIPLRFSLSLLSTTTAAEVKKIVAKFKNLIEENLRFFHLQDSTVVDNGISDSSTIKQIKESAYTVFLYEMFDPKLDRFKEQLVLVNMCRRTNPNQKLSFTRQFYVKQDCADEELYLKVYEMFREHLLLIEIKDIREKDLKEFISSVKNFKYKELSQEYSELKRLQIYEIKKIDNQITLFLQNIKCELLKLNRCVDSDLNLPQSPHSQLNLNDCLNSFSQEEVLESGNEWYCNKCKQHKRAKKQMEIYRAPPILILHLKRFKTSKVMAYGAYYFSGGTSKIVQFVDYPMEFTLLNYEYHLFAVSNHYGGLGGGHYTAFIRNGDNWFDFNDSIVRQLRGSPVTDAGYILFYRRK